MTDILIGFTDYTKTVFIPDPASTDGSGKTGLVAANLTVSYTRVETDNDVVVTDVTGSLNDLAALTSAHNDWGLKEISNTLAPGLYRLDIADAVFAAGAWSAVVYVMITTSAAAASPIEFNLVAYNKLDGVRLGLTALPNAAADAAGGLPISDAGGLDLDAKIGALTYTVANKVDANVTHNAGTAITSALGIQEVKVASIAANAITATAIASDAITAAKVADGTIDAATFASGAINAAAIASDAITAAKIADGAIDAATFASGAITADAIATDAIGSAELAASAITEIQSGLSTLDAAGVRSAVGLASANLDTQLDALPTAIENADALLNRDMSTGTDSGSATVRTVRQALRFLRNKWAVSGSTLTVYKEDDTTASWTGAVLTDSAAEPIVSTDPASS